IRSIPFLLIPIIAASNPPFFLDNYKRIGYSLICGCLFVTVWSWFFSIQLILNEGTAFKEFFGPLHSHHNLLKHLDMHATYLSIFIYTSIAFIVIEFENYNKYKKVFFSLVIVLLTAFMFHLLSRMAILYFGLSSFIYLIYKKNWRVFIP